MGNVLGETAAFVIGALFNLYVLILMLRLIFGWVKADFRNPLSQFILKATSPLLIPLRRFIPPVGKLDTANVLLIILVQMAGIAVIALLLGQGFTLYQLFASTLIELVSLCFYVFIFSIVIQVIMSWVNPGTMNPVTYVLFSITEPVLKPFRRIIPPIAGLDLSPFFALLLLEAARRIVVSFLAMLLG